MTDDLSTVCPTCGAATTTPPLLGVTGCRAERWHGTPCYEGPHPWHFFTYGPDGMYTGSCSGR